MKNVLFITLMLSFLVGNAQQDRQNNRSQDSKATVQYYTDNYPGNPFVIDLNRYSMRKTEFHPGNPYEVDVNRYAQRKTDNLGNPVCFDRNRYTMRKTDFHPGNPYEVNVNRYSQMKTD